MRNTILSRTHERRRRVARTRGAPIRSETRRRERGGGRAIVPFSGTDHPRGHDDVLAMNPMSVSRHDMPLFSMTAPEFTHHSLNVLNGALCWCGSSNFAREG
jgi:hypothetical protein